MHGCFSGMNGPTRWFPFGICLVCLSTLFISGCATSSYGPFRAQFIPSIKNPEIVVENNTHKSITLSLKGDPTTFDFEIPANSSRTMILKPGTYSYLGSASGLKLIPNCPEVWKENPRSGSLS